MVALIFTFLRNLHTIFSIGVEPSNIHTSMSHSSFFTTNWPSYLNYYTDPIQIPKILLKDLDQSIIRFIWNHKTLYIAKAIWTNYILIVFLSLLFDSLHFNTRGKIQGLFLKLVTLFPMSVPTRYRIFFQSFICIDHYFLSYILLRGFIQCRSLLIKHQEV